MDDTERDSFWQARSVTANDGIRLAAFDAGPSDEPTVLFVHGYPEQHGVWDVVAADLATDHHVVAYDVRGAGASEVPSHRSGWEMAQLLDDIATVIREVGGGGPVHLVGHDWGSIQGWAFVLHPEYRKLVASYTSMSGPPLQQVERRIRAWLGDVGGGWLSALAQAGSSSYIAFFQTPLAPLAWRRFIAPRWADVVAREGAVTDDSWPAATIGDDAARGVELYRAHRRAMLPPFRADRLPAVSVPTDVPVSLLVVTDDLAVRPGLLEGLDNFARSLQRQELTGGHWLPRSRPKEVAAAIREQVSR